jgi:hypothetical protein
MRRYSYNKIMMLVALSASLFYSCTEADNVIDQIVDDTTRGAILRTIRVISNELPIGTSTANFGVELEVQDVENGNLTDNVEVFVAFRDNTVADGGTDFSKSEVLVETIPRSAFTDGPQGLPRVTYSIGLQEMQTALALDESNVDGGDTFTIRFELVLTDGRRFSLANNTGTLTQAFFRAPWRYTATVVCPEVPPVPGTWTIEGQDSFGDGWNGGAVVVSLDGTQSSFTFNDGATGSFSFDVPNGTQSLIITYSSGDWDGEVTFQVFSAAGNLKGSFGPSPAAGTPLPLNYCID